MIVVKYDKLYTELEIYYSKGDIRFSENMITLWTMKFNMELKGHYVIDLREFNVIVFKNKRQLREFRKKRSET